MKANFRPIAMLIVVLMLLAGCFGGGESESSESASTAAPTVAVEVATEPAATIAVSTVEATAEATAAPADSEPQIAALAVEDVPEIGSYRVQVSVISASERGTDTVKIEGAYVKAPAAEQLTLDFQQGEQSQRMEMLMVDGTRYILTGDQWLQTPESAINIDELTLISPRNVADVLGQMELVGTETVNGLPTQHYRGSKEIIPVVGTEGDTLDVSRVEFAQLDLWVEETYNAIIRLTLEATNSQPPLSALVTFDYTDLNSAIEIVAPETMPEPSAQPEADFVPRNELGELLGFNLMFPTGSTVETVVGASLYVIVGPYTMAEAPTFIETTMQANGYTQLSKNNGPAGEVIYLFQKDAKAVSITLTDAGNGSTRFQFATGS